MQRTFQVTLAAACLILLAGCKPRPPEIVQVEGLVLLDGKPLPGALVEFSPKLDRFGAEMNSYAETDDDGHFQLTCQWQNQPGACVAEHRVAVREPPPPRGDRGTEGESDEQLVQEAARKSKARANRLIPQQYWALGSTPLVVNVVPGQTTYELRLISSQGGKEKDE